ncbi:hypothetical protein BB559_001256 [Furculomyces boomerangus]|uniref:Uncharacterized protein n=2 Tax=Harpellales TaxID=61421 RepID=A0A2T9YTK7_9FUNG|nr:hypothetical protein BB559_002630 [Furculomyces boomerangus]PVU98811.1 hypothetical protein BB559_001256 [Furculomyces boomerangus]PWA01890.1 hypothetical protein BB558_002012 [Smittium angustum]
MDYNQTLDKCLNLVFHSIGSSTIKSEINDSITTTLAQRNELLEKLDCYEKSFDHMIQNQKLDFGIDDTKTLTSLQNLVDKAKSISTRIESLESEFLNSKEFEDEIKLNLEKINNSTRNKLKEIEKDTLDLRSSYIGKITKLAEFNSFD